MRGPTIHDESGSRDPLVRAIAELRDQVDRMIDEQKAVLGGLLGGLVEESSIPEWPAPAAEPTPLAPAPEPAPRARRSAQPAAVAAPASFDRIDEPAPTPPRPVTPPPAAAVAEPVASNGRSEDPRERLDALAKHLDRKLKQAGPVPADSNATARAPE